MAGTEQETLSTQQIPSHSHPFIVSLNPATQTSPLNNSLGEQGTVNLYLVNPVSTPMNASSVTPVGGSQPHENTQPFLCINFIISLFGVFPSQT
jgi:microcystin-dependent protein